MPSDFDDKIRKIQSNDDRIQSLSKSQAVYFLISDIASRCSNDDSKSENSSGENPIT
jgi:hypothetical protein